MSRAQDQLRQAVEADIAWLEARQKRWAVECAGLGRLRIVQREPWWLGYGERELAVARRRLEELLERG